MASDPKSNHQIETNYVTYPQRWFVLATVAVLNFSNAMAWINFAAITNFSAEYFNVTTDQINWLSIVYLVVTIPIGFVSIWVMDNLGIRSTILIGAWFNFVGIAVRCFSGLSGISDDARYPIVMTGQTIAAVAQPFLLFVPTKLAAVWFAEDQRAIANAIGSMSNPFGILMSFLISALLVSEPDDIPLMLLIYLIPAVIGVAMATFGVCSNEPPTPPSASADEEGESFYKGFLHCIKTPSFIILWIAFGARYGVFNAISTFLEQIVCPLGHGDDFAGIVGALMLGCGLIGAFVAGLIVDKTHKFTPIMKFNFVFGAIGVVFLVVFSNFPEQGGGLAFGAVLFGTFGLALFPVALELGVECTYPIREGTSSGLLQISGQLQGIILILIAQVASESVPLSEAPDIQKCIVVSDTPGATVPPNQLSVIQDMTVPLYVIGGYTIVVCCGFVLLFRTKYKRLAAEGYAAGKKEPSSVAKKAGVDNMAMDVVT
ncbi:putative major facilitator superfamily domain-containing protein 7 [Apostichopus japonicus]|uniref:Putative major facilitator superfamily domain-containing protein 7 n=1 Tax=Stichopus japonicus TaxID=307972 RepID=A0A2G8KTL3_STIJA|nr:putative major facilitator superfamily domain-containing protein 7 [Apostichopus japonicus]